MDILEKATKILKQPICDNCLGRQFAQLLHGYSNEKRGKIMRTAVAMSIDMEDYDISKLEISNFADFEFHNLELAAKKQKKCSLCNNFFENLDPWVDKIIKKAKNIQFKTFLIGTKLSFDLIRKEEDLWERVGIDYCEPLKAEINREIGKLLEKKLNVRYNPKNPDVNFILNISSKNIILEINPVFIYGEYQKLIRGIPQTRWPSGKYKNSVEQIIAKPFMLATKGKAHKLHGCVSGKTTIFLNNHALAIKKLENEWKQHKVLTYNEKNGTIETSKIRDFIKLQMYTYRLRTKETGREIIASGDHPFFTPSGMKALIELKTEDKVAVNPEPPENFEIHKERLLLSEDDLLGTAKKYLKYRKDSFLRNIIMELKDDFIPLYTTNRKLPILTRLVAFLFGDGHVKIIRNRDVSLEFYGEYVDLKRIQDEIKILGFNSSIHTKKGQTAIVTDYFGKKKYIKGTTQNTLTCYSKSLWLLLVALGAPVGNKVVKDLQIPFWIKNGDRYLKREFLATLLGCEMDISRLDDRKYNRKSFNCPRFSMNKIETYIKNGIQFIEDIAEMLKEFDIKTYKIRLVPYTTRKNGDKSIKIVLDFSNKFENLINLYKNVGLIYCKQKQIAAKLTLEYLRMKKHIIDERKRLFKKALLLKEQGYQLAEISKRLNSDFVAKKDLWLWVHKKIKEKNIKVPNSFPNFDEWVMLATTGLNEGLLWETIDTIDKNGTDIVYDITVPKNHNFFANGFLVSNCGREDIDARCLAWRPFVLEIIEPKNRDINLNKISKKIKKSVKVRRIRFSDIVEVRKIKETRVDKTYRVSVFCEKPIERKDLRKLSALIGEIRQRTPKRVLHRRADRLRKRKVKEIRTRFINKRNFELVVRGEAGLYIKELVDGDDGRTRPSISSLLGFACSCKNLDVVKIHTK